MRGKPQNGRGARFEVPSQSGELINNVGGNQYFGDRPGRSAMIGRVVAALGLALIFGGLLLLGAAGIAVYQDTNGFTETSEVVLPGYAATAGGLVVAGIVLNRFGRLFAGK